MASKFAEDTVRKVAELARLQLSDAEVKKFTVQVGGVLEYIEKLNKLDTSKLEPLTHPLDLATPLRDDEPRAAPGSQAMLESAPAQLYENYKVPQVLGGGN